MARHPRIVKNHEILADDATENIDFLLRLRFPSLIVGIIGGGIASILVSRFESVIQAHISLAFFMPLIVYISDAIGGQTRDIFVRNLGKHKIHVLVYFIKELLIGIIFGITFGFFLGFFAYLWIGSFAIAFTVGLAMFVNCIIAPILGLSVPILLKKEHTDPAVGAGPLTTVVQDILSLVVYFTIASVIIF